MCSRPAIHHHRLAVGVVRLGHRLDALAFSEADHRALATLSG